MTPSSLCCSWELAKKLKALCVKQESCFSWHQVLSSNIDTGEVIESGEWRICANSESGRTHDDKYGRKRWPAYAAFTAGELGEMLPDGYQTYRRGSSWFVAKDFEKLPIGVACDTEANCRAACLIHLIENGILKIE